jgi:hypothetical protein
VARSDGLGRATVLPQLKVKRLSRTLGSSSITMTVAGALAMACSRKEQNAATDARQRGKQSIIPVARINASPKFDSPNLL